MFVEEGRTSGSPFARTLALATAPIALSVPASRNHVRVLRSEFMSVLTVSAVRIKGACAPSSPDVLLQRHRFQMFGVDTQTVPAQMVDGQASGNRTNEHRIRSAVNAANLPVVVNAPVARSPVVSALPLPTSVLANYNLRVKPSLQRSICFGGSVTLAPHPRHCTRYVKKVGGYHLC